MITVRQEAIIIISDSIIIITLLYYQRFLLNHSYFNFKANFILFMVIFVIIKIIIIIVIATRQSIKVIKIYFFVLTIKNGIKINYFLMVATVINSLRVIN